MSLKDTLKKAKKIERQLAQQREITNLKALSTVKPRNYLALDPLLRKGGIHEEDNIDSARKKLRRETKQQLRQKDWLSE